jgi:pimeloyl-ACP methyl ester carboxylesterase
VSGIAIGAVDGLRWLFNIDVNIIPWWRPGDQIAPGPATSEREEVVTVATYVLVHGGGHGGWCYQRVARLLRAEGHEVYTPTLTGLGERAHLLDDRVDLDRHVADVAAVLRVEDLREVILVGHSYGGMVITGAADREADRVGRLVYLDAATPVHGQSLVDVAGPVINAVRPMGEVVDGIELVLLPAPDAGMLYGVTDPADLAWMAERLTGHPWKCFEQPLMLEHEDALWAIPQFHVVCTSTLATRDADLMDRARAEGRLWDIDTGHDLMITEPERTADALLQVAVA